MEKCGCADSMDVDIYSEELEIKKKKVRITLEFPCTVDPKDADRFEHMLKDIYLNQIRSLRSGSHAEPLLSPKGEMQNKFACEISLQGGMSHE